MTRQLPLPFADAQIYNEQDFVSAPSNSVAQAWLQNPASWTNGRLILWGDPGCGKTFMLQIWAQQSGAVVYQGSSLHGLTPPPATPIAIDDADFVPEEPALLHLLNAATQAGQPVLLTARTPPARQHISLPDLASRLRASLTAEIAPPDDTLLSTLLLHLGAGRQLTLSIQVSNFLLQRLPRTPAALREAIARLDRAALASKGKITQALAAAVLDDLINPDLSAEKLLSNIHSPGSTDLL